MIEIDTSGWDDLIKTLSKTKVPASALNRKNMDLDKAIDKELDKVVDKPRIENLRFAKCCHTCAYRKRANNLLIFCQISNPDYKFDFVSYGKEVTENKRKEAHEQGFIEVKPMFVCDSWVLGDIEKFANAAKDTPVPVSPPKED